MGWNFFNKGHRIVELGFTDKWLYNRLTKKGLRKKTYTDNKGSFSYKCSVFQVNYDASCMKIQLMQRSEEFGKPTYLEFGTIFLHHQQPIARLVVSNAPQLHYFVRWVMDDTIVMGKNAGNMCR